MSDTDRSGALKRKVVDTVGGDERFSKVFDPYWNLFLVATEEMKVRSFYIRVEQSTSFYSASTSAPVSACEVVAICDGLLIDLHVDNRGYYNSRKTVMAKPLSAIGEVRFHPGNVQNLQNTQNAWLTVMTDHDDLYWCAKTEDEWGYLMGFARDLIKRIAAR